MNQYSINIDFDLNTIKELTTSVGIGQLKHEHVFSWAPTRTPTNDEDRFFALPMQVPVRGSPPD